MKVVLSRKGFDGSRCGRYPSPIIDGKLISLPIFDVDGKDDLKFSDLIYGDGRTYLDLMKELKMRGYDENSTCHLDPDLNSELNVRTGLGIRLEGWRPIFGQIDQSQAVLDKAEIGMGDIFLFFGWFRKTVVVDGKYRFDPNDPLGRHVIFGYMEVGQAPIKVPADVKDFPEWMKYHSHVRRAGELVARNNTVYVARNASGTLDFDEHRVLTKKGKRELKTHWDFKEAAAIMKKCSITYHPDPWKDGYFQSAYIGQEFVISPKVGDASTQRQLEEWAREII